MRQPPKPAKGPAEQKRNSWWLAWFIAHAAGGYCAVRKHGLEHNHIEYDYVKLIPLDTQPGNPAKPAKWISDGLEKIKKDLYRVLDKVPMEVQGLLDALRAGKINGSKYSGACACLVGTVMNLHKGSKYRDDYSLLTAAKKLGIHARVDKPSETWFLSIDRGDTPSNNIAAKYAEQWILEWLEVWKKGEFRHLWPRKLKEFSGRMIKMKAQLKNSHVHRSSDAPAIHT